MKTGSTRTTTHFVSTKIHRRKQYRKSQEGRTGLNWDFQCNSPSTRTGLGTRNLNYRNTVLSNIQKVLPKEPVLVHIAYC